MNPDAIEYLRFQFANARPILFTGAGFSLGATDLDGKLLPTGPGLARELWAFSYPGEPYEEGNTLADLFHIAATKQRTKLNTMLQRRFTVAGNSLPSYYRPWYVMPWRRSYTLNVDNLESAVVRRFALTRAIKPVSALHAAHPDENRVPGDALEVVHLNGVMEDGIDGVTFSTSQYAQRLASQEPWYARMVADIVTHPVIFVGTPLDEPLLWQHIEYRGAKGRRGMAELRPRSFIVSPALSRARQGLLQQFNIEWVKMTAEEFSVAVLDPLSSVVASGIQAISVRNRSWKSSPSNVLDVATEAAKAAASGSRTSQFLLGDEPTWNDIQSARAIERSADRELLSKALAVVGKRDAQNSSSLLVVTGTAGSGKSTALMRLALRLVAEGRYVAWIDRDVEIDPRDIRAYCRNLTQPTVLMIDAVDRYGSEAAAILHDVLTDDNLSLAVVALRSSKVDRALNPNILQHLHKEEVVMPPLTDEDIGELIDTLDRENRLGKLKGKPRTQQELAFRDKCGRQLLVAMIEATSGERFEEKILQEWRELDEMGRELYALISVATSLRYAMSREDVIVALGDHSNKALNTLDQLMKRHVIAVTGTGRLRARHRVIAEFLVEELHQHGNNLAQALSKLAFMAGSQVSQFEPRTSRNWRFLKSVLNHDYLQRIIGVENARSIYETVEPLLAWDYHYWLQRGSLEVESSSGRLAENFLEQARSLAPADPYVTTEYAYMLFRKAIDDPGAVSSADYVQDAIKDLRDQIAARGRRDEYPYHILGSQALAWSRRAAMNVDQRVWFLRSILQDVERGTSHHPGSAVLIQIITDLRKEILGLGPKGP